MATEPTVRARKLRNNPTEPEARLWAHLRRLRADGYHFRRQKPFRDFVLDFVCLDRMLVVELDGGHYADGPQADHDVMRDSMLRRAGYTVLRFPNRDVRTNINGVMLTILSALEAAPSRFGRTPAHEARTPTRPALPRRSPSPEEEG